jgi:hypothetical protein
VACVNHSSSAVLHLIVDACAEMLVMLETKFKILRTAVGHGTDKDITMDNI